jgi:hypothetical protein
MESRILLRALVPRRRRVVPFLLVLVGVVCLGEIEVAHGRSSHGSFVLPPAPAAVQVVGSGGKTPCLCCFAAGSSAKRTKKEGGTAGGFGGGGSSSSSSSGSGSGRIKKTTKMTTKTTMPPSVSLTAKQLLKKNGNNVDAASSDFFESQMRLMGIQTNGNSGGNDAEDHVALSANDMHAARVKVCKRWFRGTRFYTHNTPAKHNVHLFFDKNNVPTSPTRKPPRLLSSSTFLLFSSIL